jgi:signal transduction histidine kinase
VTEDRSDIPVALHVGGEDGGRPPRRIETAAFRIAQLALDNAVLHGRPSSIELDVTADARAVILEVRDDGRGITAEAEPSAVTAGRRGLADMRRLAIETGAALDVVAGPERGTVVAFRWPA